MLHTVESSILFQVGSLKFFSTYSPHQNDFLLPHSPVQWTLVVSFSGDKNGRNEKLTTVEGPAFIFTCCRHFLTNCTSI